MQSTIQFLSFTPPSPSQREALRDLFGDDVIIVTHPPTVQILDLKVALPVVVHVEPPASRLSRRLHDAGFIVWRPIREEFRSDARPWEPRQRLAGFSRIVDSRS